jgi:uncharacterized protein YllA (UPF0747 family)
MSDKNYIKTLEDSNKNLNEEIDRLRKMLSAHGIDPDKELDRVTEEAYDSGYENHYNRYINEQIQIEKRNKIKEAYNIQNKINRKLVDEIWKLAHSNPSPYIPEEDKE